MRKILSTCFILLIGLSSCRHSINENSLPGAELQHFCNQTLTDVIVYDIISPPVASRMYAYSNLAFYEGLRNELDTLPSLLSQLHGFETLPVNSDSYKVNHRLTAALAFLKVAKALAFSKDSFVVVEDKIKNAFDTLSSASLQAAEKRAREIAAVILKRASNDRYKLTRGMPKYSVFGEKGKWVQTPPEYADATEPHWRLIKPLLLDTAAQFRPAPPPPFDLNPASVYFKELQEVYEVSRRLTPEQDTIAQFWDDNPFVTKHAGHFTYANKKITPVGHWMGLLAIFSRQTGANELKTALAYATTAAAIFDGFISCWDEKFNSSTVRPITVIRSTFQSEWNSLLQTPPFPEYTSGHSVISAAAATTSIAIFGNEFSFTDTVEVKYLNLARNFASIRAAADEAGISRLYGGIHFRAAIEEGKKQGNKIGELYVSKLLLKK
ncbi:MAG: vanadium-dependent haloperoxidase [Bacteroidota bacterium]